MEGKEIEAVLALIFVGIFVVTWLTWFSLGFHFDSTGLSLFAGGVISLIVAFILALDFRSRS